MKISIIVVCLNAGNALTNTIQSILSQENVDFEIIIKDGCSADGSIEQLSSDSRIKLFQVKDNGIYDAMNQAINHITGDYVIFMNAGDSFYSSTSLSEIACFIDTKGAPLNTIFYGDYRAVNRNCNVLYPDCFDDLLCFTKVLCHQATVYSSDLLKKRSFCTNYKIAADYEYYVYSYTHGISLQHIPRVIVRYEGNGASEKKENRIVALQESKKIRKDNFPGARYRKAWCKAQLHGSGIKHLLVTQEWFYPCYKKCAEIYYNSVKNH